MDEDEWTDRNFGGNSLVIEDNNTSEDSVSDLESDEDEVKLCENSTVWKFHNFSVTQILREINFGDSRSAKPAISTHLEGLNLNSYEFLHFLKAEIYQINKIHSPKMAKIAVL